MKGLLEFKQQGGELKDVDVKSRIVTGYFSTWSEKADSYGDVMVKGAFAKSLKERRNDILFLNQHNWDQPHGGLSILREDEKGLYFESNPLIDTTYSSDALKLYAAGIMKEHSFGYQTVKSDYDEKKEIRYIKEVKLYEGSNVTIGANRDTPFTGFKSGIKELNDRVSKISKFLRTGDVTDETFIQLEIALKQLQLEAFELGKKSLEDEPHNRTHVIEPISIIKEFNKQLKS